MEPLMSEFVPSFIKENLAILKLHVLSFVNSYARFSWYHEAQLILFVNVLLIFIGIISNKYLTFWSDNLIMKNALFQWKYTLNVNACKFSYIVRNYAIFW